jgi:hypothetical protein
VAKLTMSTCGGKTDLAVTIYISQGRYTAAANKGMTAKPEDRSERSRSCSPPPVLD